MAKFNDKSIKLLRESHRRLLTAAKAVLKHSGENIMGEKLCPVCSMPERHDPDCPIPELCTAVEMAMPTKQRLIAAGDPE